MEIAYTVIFYMFSFLAVYVQVFFFITFLEKRKSIVKHAPFIELKNYPTVTITVPCYNEEKTIDKTIESLLSLDYPKDKLSIFIVDDGSTDNTWNIIKKFENISNIKIFHQENGGKYTAMNLGLKNTTAEFFGCLDSDSFVHPQSLKRIMSYFENDEKTMAVAPSIIVHNPKNIIQSAQKVDYDMAVYTKKMLGFMGGIHVTPGPFSIFRKAVFNELGPYRKAHNTEDQEIALRMQEHGYKIDHCPDAYVYTISPNSIMKLYRQRLRWIYGFIRNLADYRRIIFKRKYGAIAMFTLPSGIISIFGVLLLFSNFVYNAGSFLYHKLLQIQAVGVSNSSGLKFDWFYINAKASLILIFVLYALVITSSIIGRKLASEKRGFSFKVFYFIIVYSLISPFWMLKAIYNAVIGKESSWIFERRAVKN